jgi:hypothetical protein
MKNLRQITGEDWGENQKPRAKNATWMSMIEIARWIID